MKAIPAVQVKPTVWGAHWHQGIALRWVNHLEMRHQYVQIHPLLGVPMGFGSSLGLWSQVVSTQRAVHPGLTPSFLPAEPSPYARSVFFSDCFFCEGLEMTLISLLWKVPISCPLLKKSFRTRRKCFRLSASEMYSALAQPKPCQGQRGAVGSSSPAPPAFLTLLTAPRGHNSALSKSPRLVKGGNDQRCYYRWNEELGIGRGFIYTGGREFLMEMNVHV